MCACSLDHITPSRLGLIRRFERKTTYHYFNKGALAPRLSLYDTSWTFVSKRSLLPDCQRTRTWLQRQARFRSLCAQSHSELVGLGGLEPPASPLSGVRSNHLSYRPKSRARLVWWSLSGSNRRPPACKAGALPAELWPRVPGRSECRSLVRTPDRQFAVFCL